MGHLFTITTGLTFTTTITTATPTASIVTTSAIILVTGPTKHMTKHVMKLRVPCVP